ncbi:MAG: phage tail protein [Spirochaetota bacterium]
MTRKLFNKFTSWVVAGIGLGTGLFLSYLFAVSVGTLNTFTSGSTVSSSQINDNFTTLKTAIESLNTEVQTNLTSINTNSLSTIPKGTILSYAGVTAPTGFLLCQGQAVSRTTYADLFTIIGTTWGSGDGSTTFNVPDSRAASPTGFGTSTKYTENETLSLGSHRNDQFQGHAHTVWRTVSTVAVGALPIGQAASSSFSDNVNTADIVPYNTYGTPRIGNTTRGKQFVVNFIIKY